MAGLYAEPLIYAWTGDMEAAAWGSKILIWFALGNGVLAINAFQYYLQSAFGQLRLHVIGSSISALIQVPVIYYAAVNYGAEGAGIAWFSFRLVWFLWWTPIVHSRFIPGFHLSWILKDILPIVITTVVLALSINYLVTLDLTQNRLLLFLEMVALGLLLLTISAFSAKPIRDHIFKRLKK